MKTANLAIVFTDIKGFTERTSHQTLEENERLLGLHSALLTPLFKAFGGKIIKSIGDAFLVTFESPTQAVLSGVAIQDRLWQHNREAPEGERFEVRIAINVGEVRLESNDVFGEPVNIASRVEGIAEAGEVYFTEAVHLSMNKAEVPAEEVGAFELKGIPGKIRVFRVPKAPYRVEAPVAAPPGEGNLPPFGNIGLAKVQDDLKYRGLAATAEISVKAAELGGQLVERTTQALSTAARGRKLPVTPRTLALAAGAIVLAVVLGFLFSGSELDSALEAVEDAPASERSARAEAARRLIGKLKEQGEAEFYSGRLEEALGEPGAATSRYRNAARAGHGGAIDRLLELLSHPKCRVRSAAAGALGEAKVKSARGKLERLAERGGPDDDNVPLLGCNSKGAAEDALRRLQ